MKSRIWRLAMVQSTALTALMVAGAAPALASTGQAVLDDWVSFSQANPIVDVSYETAREDGNALTVSSLDIIVSAGAALQFFTSSFGMNIDADGLRDLNELDVEYRLSMPSVTFQGLTVEDDHIVMDAILADTVELYLGTDVPGASTQIYSGVTGAGLAFALWPEVDTGPDRPVSQFLPLLQAMTDFDATSLIVQTVDVTSDIDDDVTISQSYGPLIIGPTRDGNISSISASNLSMTAIEDGSELLFEVTANAVSATDYNYGTTLETFFAPANGDDDYQTSVGTMNVSDLQVRVPEDDFVFSIEFAGISDVGVRPPSVDVLGGVDELVRATMADKREPSEEELIGLVGAVYGALSLGNLVITDVSAEGEDFEAFTLDSFLISNLSAEGLGEISLNGLDIVGGDGEIIRIGRSALEGLTFPPMDALMGLEAAIAAQDIPAVLAGIPTLDRIVQNDLRFLILDDDVDVAVGSSIFEMLNHIGPIPTGLRLGIDGLRADIDTLDPEERETFEALGLETFVLSSDALVQWDRDTSDINIDLLASVEQLGTLTGEGTIGSVPAIVFEQPDQSTIFALLGATLKDISVRLDDDGVVERGIALAAEDEGISYEAMELRLKGMVPVILAELDNVELAAQIANAVTAFLENGAPLAARIVAPTPLPIAAIAATGGDPASLARLFEIEVVNP